MNRLLVTGGAGFIGTNFVYYWHARHPADRIVVLDALTYAGHRTNLAPLESDDRFRFVNGDINDQRLVEGLLREERVTTVVHFAAESHVDRSIEGPDAFIETNIVGTHALLKAARRVWLDPANPVRTHRFHHVSTDEVYGSLNAGDPAFTETTPYDPSSPYSASKAASDHLVRAYHRTYGLNVTVSNCSNNYGPFHYPEKLIPLALINVLEGKPVPVYGDGKNIRDWLFVEDHCAGIEAILTRGTIGETYNIGGANERTNIHVVTTLCDALDRAFKTEPTLRLRFPRSPAGTAAGARSLIRFVTDRPGHDWRYAIDARKSNEQLGYIPRYDFETGITATVTWFLANESWWRGVMDKDYQAWSQLNYATR